MNGAAGGALAFFVKQSPRCLKLLAQALGLLIRVWSRICSARLPLLVLVVTLLLLLGDLFNMASTPILAKIRVTGPGH